MKSVVLVFSQVVAKSGLNLESMAAAVAGWFAGAFEGDAAAMRALAILLALVIFDWVTGVRASRYDGKPIESSKLSRTSDKIIAYGVGIVTLLLVSREIPGLKEYRAELVTSLSCWFMAVESWSILENCDRMGVRVPAWVKSRLKVAVDGLEKGDDVARGWKPNS